MVEDVVCGLEIGIANVLKLKSRTLVLDARNHP